MPGNFLFVDNVASLSLSAAAVCQRLQWQTAHPAEEDHREDGHLWHRWEALWHHQRSGKFWLQTHHRYKVMSRDRTSDWMQFIERLTSSLKVSVEVVFMLSSSFDILPLKCWCWTDCVSSFSLQYMRSLNNFRAEQPHQHAMYYLRLLMTEVAWTKDELREALDGEALLLIALFLSLLLSQSPNSCAH